MACKIKNAEEVFFKIKLKSRPAFVQVQSGRSHTRSVLHWPQSRWLRFDSRCSSSYRSVSQGHFLPTKEVHSEHRARSARHTSPPPCSDSRAQIVFAKKSISLRVTLLERLEVIYLFLFIYFWQSGDPLFSFSRLYPWSESHLTGDKLGHRKYKLITHS